MHEQDKPNVGKVLDSLGTVDQDVPYSTNTDPNSFTSRMAAMAVGGTEYRGYPMSARNPGMTMLQMSESLAEQRYALRKSVEASVRGAKAKTNGEFTVTVFATIAPDNQVHLVAGVTRTA